MKVVNQSYQILTTLDDRTIPIILRGIEEAGRTAYKSIQTDDLTRTKLFIQQLIESAHESVLEHGYMTVKFITDRGVTHELVRHRLASYTQESTRFCNYSKGKFGNQVTFVAPTFVTDRPNEKVFQTWKKSCEDAEKRYFELLDSGCLPQDARSVLPTCVKAEIVVTANWREWRHILKLRTASDAHPQMRALMTPLLEELKENLGCLFDDI